jgi:peptidyl-tRNA hydrolase
MQLKMEGRTTHNTALESIFKHFRTEQFARLAIGVGHPSWKATQGDHLMNHGYENSFYRDMFLGNKFPAEEQLVRSLPNNAMTSPNRLI